MKPPSKNISKSLAGQRAKGRGAEDISVTGQTAGVSMTVPGDGKVQDAPGADRNQGGERSARKYVEPMKRFGGG
jgi:hypothetical protein